MVQSLHPEGVALMSPGPRKPTDHFMNAGDMNWEVTKKNAPHIKFNVDPSSLLHIAKNNYPPFPLEHGKGFGYAGMSLLEVCIFLWFGVYLTHGQS